MIISKAHILELDTPIGKRYRVLLEGYRLANSAMKNGKIVQAYCIYSGGELNPFGFGTLEEIRTFYDKERYLTKGIPEPKNFNFLMDYYNPSLSLNEIRTMPFIKICDMVTRKLNKPTTLTKLFRKVPKISINFEISGYSRNFTKIFIEEVYEEWLKVRSLAYKITSIVFHGYHESKKQREEMENNYFLIRVIHDSYEEYVMPPRGSISETTLKKHNAIQFKSEDEALDFVQKYQSFLGVTGFIIEEIPGMKLEDGLEIW